MNKKQTSLDTIINYGLLAAVLIIASLPLLQFGFNGDDAYNSTTQGKLILAQKGLGEFTKEIIANWFYNQGRFFPIPFIVQYSLFYLIGSHLFLYNFIHWLGLLTAIVFSALFFYQILEKKGNIILFFCLFPFCWSLMPNSFLVCQSLLMPLVISFSMATFLFYIKFLHHPKKSYLFYLSFFYLLALLTYEVALVVPAVILLINKKFKGKYLDKKTLAVTSLIFISTFAYLLLTFVIRHYSHLSYNGTSFGDFNKIPLTFLIQLAGELPFISYHLIPVIILTSSNYFLASLLFISSTLLLYRAFDLKHFPEKISAIFLISLAFQFIPAFLIAISKGYQNRLFLGTSHVPAFLQQVGFCMMLSLLVMSGLKFLKNSKVLPYFKAFTAIIISLVISFSFLINQASTNVTSSTLRYPREIYEKALAMNLLDSLPPNATIIKRFFPGEMIWNSRELRAQLINRPDIRLFDFISGNPANTDLTYDSSTLSLTDTTSLYYLDFNFIPNSPQAGYVMLAHVKQQAGKAPDLELHLDQIKVFYHAESIQDLKIIAFLLANKYPKLALQNLQKINRNRLVHTQIFRVDQEMSYHT